jgi:replicative superfamily II helicase
MVDFNKQLGNGSLGKKINPIEIYSTLDRKSDAGPLRPAQEEILKEWHEKFRESKDIILKLHTGQGKTLIGLLILQSKLNQGNSPCVYVCPNIYLVKQTCLQAKKFGIKYCRISEDKELPEEFLNGTSILITHVQKIFNGLTKFGTGSKSLYVDTIILDDSHACIDSIKGALSINLKSDHPVYLELLNLFEEDIKYQGEGSFIEIQSKEFNTILPVPYWAWYEKKSQALEILSKYRSDKEILFAWQIIKDNLENCCCLFSGKELEISLYITPIWEFGSFHNASQRILMSATNLDDSFFIKGLGIQIEAIKNPLTYKNEKWSGEKMILLPTLIHEDLDRVRIANVLGRPNEKNRMGIVVLVPSSRKGQLYNELGSIIADKDNIFDEIEKLKARHYGKTLVIVNRYDGIDLPDDSCRILVIDSKPYNESLVDRYEESVRFSSEIINVKTAQKIEQGLGRSVRGEKDYCAILLIGQDLVNFIKNKKTRDNFSLQTRQQIEIGLEVTKLAMGEVSEDQDPIKIVINLINQSLGRDEGWKRYYVTKMDNITEEEKEKTIYNTLLQEKTAEERFYFKDVEKGATIAQQIADSFSRDPSEKGWYLQMLARFKYLNSKVESNKIQTSAFRHNPQLLKPKEGFSYDKISFINENRLSKIKTCLRESSDFNDLMLSVEEILSNLSFNENAEKFESALQKLGSALGFLSQRPDKEFKRGPDNLWCGIDNEYFLFECKNEVDEKRTEVNKTEVAQMNTSCAWFQEVYQSERVRRIMIIPTKNVTSLGSFAYDIRIMRKGTLNLLKANFKSFIKELKNYSIEEISDEKLQELINFHKLDIKSLRDEYCENYYKPSV